MMASATAMCVNHLWSAGITCQGAPGVAVRTNDTVHPPSFVGAVIDVVDFGARPGTIFYVPSEDESTTAVVWLTDDDVNGE